MPGVHIRWIGANPLGVTPVLHHAHCRDQDLWRVPTIIHTTEQASAVPVMQISVPEPVRSAEAAQLPDVCGLQIRT
jgi:hypothetical protein